jgi:hypothetical protein
VSYSYAPDWKSGRLYARDPSLQKIKGVVKRLICDHYDLDLYNCAVVLTSQLAIKTLGKAPKMVVGYAKDRPYFFNMCRETHPQFTDKQLKPLFLAVLHGGSHTSPKVLEELNIPVADWPTIAQPIPTLKQWEEAVKKMTNALWEHPDHAALRKRVEVRVSKQILTKPDKKPNAKGSFLAFLWQDVESKIIQELLSFFTKAGSSGRAQF